MVGGWSILATLFASLVMVTTAHSRDTISSLIKRYGFSMGIGIALALIGAIPPLLADHSGSDDILIAARSIYVNHRIAHHLSFDAFPSLHVARFVGVLLFWIFLSRWLSWKSHSYARRLGPLFLFCYGSLAIRFAGSCLADSLNKKANTRRFAKVF